MFTWIAVASGGALGSMARHGVNRLVGQWWPASIFPTATLLVNLAGCVIIGTLAGLIASGTLPMRIHMREFIFVGILGGFTTFSTFGLDSVTLLRNGQLSYAAANVALQVLGGIGSVYVTMMFADRIGSSIR